MSNISQTGKNIKKKLSIDDYRKPTRQPNVKPAQQRTGTSAAQRSPSDAQRQTSVATNQRTASDVSRQTGASQKPAQQHNNMPAQKTHPHNDIHARQQADTASVPAYQQSATSTHQHHATTTQHQTGLTAPKIKATFYLSDHNNQLLTDVFIKRLQNRNKTDKSALIAEAIHLLYTREIKNF